MRKTRVCDKYYASLELGYILRKCVKGHKIAWMMGGFRTKSVWIETRHIRNRDGQLVQISHCPFCGKRHW